MIVFHGSTEIIKQPDVFHSLRTLDFGKGFYVTSVKEQAIRWAKRKSDILGTLKAYINEYKMKDDLSGFNVKNFNDDLENWIDFVCNCRNGKNEYEQFDIIIGKVADDKVYRVVDMYNKGIWDKKRALEEIKAYPNYNQIAFVKQNAIKALLSFRAAYEV